MTGLLRPIGRRRKPPEQTGFRKASPGLCCVPRGHDLWQRPKVYPSERGPASRRHGVRTATRAAMSVPGVGRQDRSQAYATGNTCGRVGVSSPPGRAPWPPFDATFRLSVLLGARSRRGERTRWGGRPRRAGDPRLRPSDMRSASAGVKLARLQFPVDMGSLITSQRPKSGGQQGGSVRRRCCNFLQDEFKYRLGHWRRCHLQ